MVVVEMDPVIDIVEVANTEEVDLVAERRRKHNEKMKRYFCNNPEQRQKKSQRVCERYRTDETYREAVKARARERRSGRVAVATDQ